MSLEDKLAGWTGPSSTTEQDKQDRTERMIREAIAAHGPFKDVSVSIFAKGSYANNTNVRSDSDVDIVVLCKEALYFDAAKPELKPPSAPYAGPWTPSKFRSEVLAALRAKFGDQVDATGTTAIAVNSSTARVDADVVPSFSYRYYMEWSHRDGTKVFRTDGSSIVNYPDQQLANGRKKNTDTNGNFKRTVRILKRLENEMADKGIFRELPSYFMECLTYNCPNDIFARSTWVSVVEGALYHINSSLQGDEPEVESERWLEVNECKFLFHPGQKWSRADGREFAYAAWNHLGLGSA